jgi:sulfoacetaldehyde dehydrogenase
MKQTQKQVEAKAYIEELVAKARKAQEQIEFASQKEVDAVCARMAWAGVQDSFARELSRVAVEESRLGNEPSKYAKLMAKIKGTWRDCKDAKTVGVIEENLEKGLLKIAKPVGVIGALIPCTNPEATPFCKGISVVKTRNAIIMAPHPRAQKTGKMAVDQMRKVLEKMNFPMDLIQIVEKLSMEASQELMKQSDLILATGGTGMVKEAYGSGKPALGVGAGNAVTIVDDTADLTSVADKIMRSKTFDNATSCSTENSCLIQENIYDKLIAEMEAVGGYLVPSGEKVKLQSAMWVDGHLNRDIVAQPASTIAGLAGIDLPEDKTFFMVEETGIGEGFPFSEEKLSVVTTLYKWTDFDDAVQMVNDITSWSGPGHSCGIHTEIRERVLKLAEKVKISRIMINQPQCLANSGAWTNGMPMTMTLGCGTWGGNSTSENITWKHLLNTTWVSFPIAANQPTDEELFGADVMGEDYS